MNSQDLGQVASMLGSGAVKSVIDRSYTLAEVPAAVAYVEEGHARGKVIITVD
jgi:NADPH:quinone reductase-like Zn-dependent oxidoreductase